jgi:hypothetical protein
LSPEAPKLTGDVTSFAVTNHPGLVAVRSLESPKVYLTSEADKNATVLILVRGYSGESPVPGLGNSKDLIR